ncbi:MAG: FctA domain-containing protein, partial [Bacillota bacterium]|nr:FctA domain-containing protein [Bacillota bacterium]
MTVKNAADGSFTFADVPLSTAGTHYFVIRENKSAALPGMSYDANSYFLTVVVEDVDALLTVVNVSMMDDGGAATEIKFENSYIPAETKTSFSGMKSLSGRALAADEFSFDLFETDASFSPAGPALMTVKNAADGSFVFENVLLQEEKTYYFLVKENQEAPLPGVSYDSKSYRWTIEVERAGDQLQIKNSLLQDESGTVTEMLFENSYTAAPTSVSFNGTKSLTGRALAADEFSFELFETDDSFALVDPAIMEVKNAADGSFTFADVPLTTAGSHYFVIREKSTPLLPGVSYDSSSYFLTVVVEDVDAVLTVSSLSISNGLETVTELSFENSYTTTPTSVSFSGTKSLTGRALAADEFSFELFETDDSFALVDPAIMTVKNAADGSFTFADVPLTTAGTHYFVIRENKSAALPGISYDSRSYFLTVVVEDVDAVLTVSSQSITDGTAPVTELKFENSYTTTPTSVSFNGTKSLSGRTLAAEEFSFDLFKTDDSFALVDPAIMTVKNAADGSFSFADVPLTTAGTHYFVIRENKSAALPGISYDSSSYFLTVVVEDVDSLLGVSSQSVTDGTAPVTEIRFANSYAAAPTSFSLSGTKSLSGRTLAAEEFSFDLFQADPSFAISSTPIMTVKNAADGSFSFTDVPLTTVGTHYFVIRENKSAALPGISYDSSSYFLTVVVEDVDGALTVSSQSLADENAAVTALSFANSYVEEIPPALEVELHVEKRVRNLGSEEIGPEKFNFRLEDQESGETMDVLSDEEGAACFRLNYSVEDVGREFSYRIWELDEEEEYIRYSNAEYEVKVTIRQDESSNALLAELSLDGESVESVSMEFVNEYDYTPEPPIIPSRPISDDGDAEDGGIGDGGEDDPSDGTGDPADGTG